MYDIIIIGAGPAGISAAVYGKSRGKNVLLLEDGAKVRGWIYSGGWLHADGNTGSICGRGSMCEKSETSGYCGFRWRDRGYSCGGCMWRVIQNPVSMCFPCAGVKRTNGVKR